MEFADVTVVTPCIPERVFGEKNLLGQCMASVKAQLLPPKRHIIGIDYEHVGCARMVTSLVESVDTEWFVILADDDLLMKTFIGEMILAAGPADIVYSRCIAVGADWAPRRYEFSTVELRKENYIPATALIRTEMWRKVGGYRPLEDRTDHREAAFWDAWRAKSNFRPDQFPEDWDFWLRCLDKRAYFKHVPSKNWLYRFEVNLFNQPALRDGVRGEGTGQEAAADSDEPVGVPV